MPIKVKKISTFYSRTKHILMLLLAKALYRRALGHSGMKDDDAAQADLIQASQLVKGDAAILAELEKVKQRKKTQREKEKKAFKGLFA